MDRAAKIAIAGGALAGAAAWLYLGRDGASPIDVIGDALVELTTNDETRLSQLQPDVADRVRAVLAQLASEGIRVKVGQTLRTTAQEKAVIDAGRSAVKSHSWHELGRAVDLYPYNPGTGSPDLDGVRLDLFRRMHEVAQGLGFRSIAFNDDGSKHLITNAAGKSIWDGGHIEWRAPYGSIAEAVDAEGATYGIA